MSIGDVAIRLHSKGGISKEDKAWNRKMSDAYGDAYEEGDYSRALQYLKQIKGNGRLQDLTGDEEWDDVSLKDNISRLEQLVAEQKKQKDLEGATPPKEIQNAQPVERNAEVAQEQPQKSKRDLAREAITLWRKGDKESRAMANKIWSENFTKEELAQMAQRAKANKATQEQKQRVADEATDAEKKVNIAKEMGALDKELANVQAPEPIEQTADRALRQAVEGSAPRMAERKPVIDFAELEARGYITPREDDKKSIFEGKKLSEKEMDELMTDIQDNAKTPKDLEPYYGIVDKGFLDELKNNMLNSQDN